MSSNNFFIQRAQIVDAPILAELIGKLLYDFNSKNGTNFNIDLNLLTSTCSTLLERGKFGGFIAVDTKTNDPVGAITISQSTAIYNGGDYGVITELYVREGFRSMGLGNNLLKTAKDFAKEQGWKVIEVGAPKKEEWPRTIEFYKKNGFLERGPKLRIHLE